MQLVISIFLGAILGFAAGYTLWANSEIEPAVRSLHVQGMTQIEIQAYCRKLNSVKQGEEVGDLEPKDFNYLRIHYGEQGALLGGLIGGFLCIAWANSASSKSAT